MGILAECPTCHAKQSIRNKKCKCGLSLDDAKKRNRLKNKEGGVRYWIAYRMPDGKQRRESVGAFEGLDAYSLDDAKAADAKRMVQKKEKRIFDMLPESETTFSELTEWYLSLKSVKRLATCNRIEGALSNFNAVFDHRTVDDVKRTDLVNYQEQRLETGIAPATIDKEVSIAKTMVTKAFDDDKIGGDVLKAFRTVKKKLKKGANARTRTITVDEYKGLIKEAPSHLRSSIIIGFNTGMRLGEIRKLKWTQIDRKAGLIRLTEGDTKEGKPKVVPINHHVQKVLSEVPRALNHGYVITFKGRPITERGGLKRSFATACKNAKIPCGRNVQNGITFHDIRRTVKTNMARAGVSKAFRDKLLGHAPQGMDAHYMALDEDDLRRAMDLYTAWLDGQLTNVDHSVDHQEKRVS